MTIAAVDTAYRGSEARTALVAFENWTDPAPVHTMTLETDISNEYIPGSFYLRELPCILAVLKEAPFRPEAIIIDGYVLLGTLRPGLGMHLYQAIGGRCPVIGVAKNPFKGNTEAVPVLRGRSKKPLFITSTGIDINTAAMNIMAMHGKSRIPTLLRLADRLSREFN